MRRELAGLDAEELDLVVVGGGIYGAAAAWDAAQRGLSVALVERDDFGSGASWHSLKTIHGGLRYLQKAALGRLRESARERRTLLSIAPRLVHPLPFVVPTYGYGTTGRVALAAALRVNNWLTWDRSVGLSPDAHVPPGRTVSAREAASLIPGLDARRLTGAALWSDAQASSTERLTLAFVLAAAGAGARVANHAEAVELLRAGGRVVGVALRDTLRGATLEVRSRLVLNAAGPWCDELLARGGPGGTPAPLLRARNLVLDRAPPVPFGVGARSAGRFLFLVPWQGRTLVGTDYEPADGPPSDPRVFHHEAAEAFPWAALGGSRVVLLHEGLVPGHGGPSGIATRPRLHDHETEDDLPGLVSIQGVKYTTARAVAERGVDLVMRRLGRPFVRARTAETVLPSAGGLEGDLPSRARQAVREEMALTLADAVLRRLDLGTGGPPAAAELDVVCDTLAGELDWDPERCRVERESLARVYPAPAQG